MANLVSTAQDAPTMPATTATRKRSSSSTSVVTSAACWILMAFLCLFSCMATSADAPFTPKKGRDYVELNKPVLVSQAPGIEVVQVFSYACHACAAFEPTLTAWLQKRPADVRFAYVPAVFGGAFDAAAKAYYAAEELGVATKTHEGIYRAVHTDGTLTSDRLDDIAAAYARLGVDAASFRRAYEGKRVAERVNWAKSYAASAEVSSTPTLIVAGKYRVAMGRDERGDKLVATVDFLIDMERKKRGAN